MVSSPVKANNLSEEEKFSIIQENFKSIMEAIGLDLTDDSLKDTPKRIAKMYLNEIFSGLNEKLFPKMTTIENKMGIDEMICVKDVKVMSVCEHHFATIHGTATVAYIANKKVIGLSKINRLVDFYSRRPQVQERLTKQITDKLVEVLETEDVAVFINAKHYCVISRGIQDQNSTTSTSDLRGRFKTDSSTRSEFIMACKTP